MKEAAKKGLERYLRRETHIIPKTDGKVLRYPVRFKDIPRFRHGFQGGVGHGDGEPGDILKRGGENDKPGHGEGDGDHFYAEFTKADAAEILGKELELPNLLEKEAGKIGTTKKPKYTSISRTGPDSLRHFKRTYKRALKRTIASGMYNPKDPIVIPIRADFIYKASRALPNPDTKAAILYLLDTSGSMHNVIDFMQNVGWWTDAWIGYHYKEVERRFIQYDWSAEETSESEFYTIQSSGGTRMRAGYNLAKKIAERDYPESEYNLYVVHFTDGDCHGMEVTKEELEFYRSIEDQHEEISEIVADMEKANPLTSYFIPRCSGIFVCEAGAYFRMDNYTDMLELLLENAPSLESKLRCVSYKEDDIIENRGKRVIDTIEHWFS